MKKLLFALFLIALVSCEKDEPVINDPAYCWECKKDVTTPSSYSSMMMDFCMFTTPQIKEIIKQNTDTIGEVKRTMECKIKQK